MGTILADSSRLLAVKPEKGDSYYKSISNKVLAGNYGLSSKRPAEPISLESLRRGQQKSYTAESKKKAKKQALKLEEILLEIAKGIISRHKLGSLESRTLMLIELDTGFSERNVVRESNRLFLDIALGLARQASSYKKGHKYKQRAYFGASGTEKSRAGISGYHGNNSIYPTVSEKMAGNSYALRQKAGHSATLTPIYASYANLQEHANLSEDANKRIKDSYKIIALQDRLFLSYSAEETDFPRDIGYPAESASDFGYSGQKNISYNWADESRVQEASIKSIYYSLYQKRLSSGEMTTLTTRELITKVLKRLALGDYENAKIGKYKKIIRRGQRMRLMRRERPEENAKRRLPLPKIEKALLQNLEQREAYRARKAENEKAGLDDIANIAEAWQSWRELSEYANLTIDGLFSANRKKGNLAVGHKRILQSTNNKQGLTAGIYAKASTEKNKGYTRIKNKERRKNRGRIKNEEPKLIAKPIGNSQELRAISNSLRKEELSGFMTKEFFRHFLGDLRAGFAGYLRRQALKNANKKRPESNYDGNYESKDRGKLAANAEFKINKIKPLEAKTNPLYATIKLEAAKQYKRAISTARDTETLKKAGYKTETKNTKAYRVKRYRERTKGEIGPESNSMQPAKKKAKSLEEIVGFEKTAEKGMGYNTTNNYESGFFKKMNAAKASEQEAGYKRPQKERLLKKGKGQAESEGLQEESLENISYCIATGDRHFKKALEYAKERSNSYPCNGELKSRFHHNSKSFRLRDYIRNGVKLNGFKLAESIVADGKKGSYRIRAYNTKAGAYDDLIIPKDSVYAVIDRKLKGTAIWKLYSFIDTETGREMQGLYLETIAEYHLEAKKLLGDKDKNGVKYSGLIILVNGKEPEKGRAALDSYRVKEGAKIELVYKTDRARY